MYIDFIHLHIHSLIYFHNIFLEIDSENYEFSDDELLPYAKAYLEEKYKLLGKESEPIHDIEVQTLHWHMKLFWVVSIRLFT